MNVYEMEGFLRGKCLPGDLLVGESNAAYLVRKLNEATTLKADRDALADKLARLEYNLGNALIGEQETIRRADALVVEKAIDLLLNKFSGTGHIGVPIMALESLAIELREAK